MAAPSLTRVVRAGRESYDVLIDRGGPFGNPYHIESPTPQARLDAIEKFRAYFLRRITSEGADGASFRQKVNALRGRVLGCHCVPKPCHGHVIAAYLDEGLFAITMPADDDSGTL